MSEGVHIDVSSVQAQLERLHGKVERLEREMGRTRRQAEPTREVSAAIGQVLGPGAISVQALPDGYRFEYLPEARLLILVLPEHASEFDIEVAEKVLSRIRDEVSK